jgi:hypothetical protein
MFEGFFHERGYFDQSSQLEPLLHFWTLAVEWQFYLIWPLVMRFFGLISVSLFALVITSMAHILAANGFTWSYFTVITRCGPILAGAALAMYQKAEDSEHSNSLKGNWSITGHLMSLLSLGAILVSSLLLNSGTVYPGFAATLSVLGSLFLISSGDTVAARLLSWSPVVSLGRISYSLYLIHWPVMALLRAHGVPFHTFNMINITMWCLVTSSLVYVFVEQPFLSRWRFSSNRTIIFLFVIPAVLIMCGSLVMVTISDSRMKAITLREVPVTKRDAVQKAWLQENVVERYRDHNLPRHFLFQYCETQVNNPFLKDFEALSLSASLFPWGKCAIGSNTSVAPRVLMIGDSFTPAYAGLVEIYANALNRSFWNIGIPAQVPRISLLSATKQIYAEAVRMSLRGELDAVILCGAWSRLRLKDFGSKFPLQSGGGGIEAAISLIKRLHEAGLKVMVLGSTPFFFEGHTVSRMMNDGLSCDEDLRVATANIGRTVYWSPSDYMCNDTFCSRFDKFGIDLVRADNVHMTFIGGQVIASSSIWGGKPPPWQFKWLFKTPHAAEKTRKKKKLPRAMEDLAVS